jgi:hypothetical protein
MQVLKQQLVQYPSGECYEHALDASVAICLIVDKRVQDGHRLVGDTSIKMNLFENWKARQQRP